MKMDESFHVNLKSELQNQVDGPIQNCGVFMSKGSFSQAQYKNAMTDGIKMVSGLWRKKKGGDLTGTSTGKAVMGLDNHQTVLVVTPTTLYAFDSQTSMARDFKLGSELGHWPLSEITVNAKSKKMGGQGMLQVNLEILHPPTDGGGNLESVIYENMEDPTEACYKALASLS